MNLYLVATFGALGCNLGSMAAVAATAGGARPSGGANTSCWPGRTWTGRTRSSAGSAGLIARMLPVLRTA